MKDRGITSLRSTPSELESFADKVTKAVNVKRKHLSEDEKSLMRSNYDPSIEVRVFPESLPDFGEEFYREFFQNFDYIEVVARFVQKSREAGEWISLRARPEDKKTEAVLLAMEQRNYLERNADGYKLSMPIANDLLSKYVLLRQSCQIP
jgi:hypothetical protein